jgi:hypothetical protein
MKNQRQMENRDGVYKTNWQRQTKIEGKLTGKETDRQGDNYKKDLIGRTSLQKSTYKRNTEAGTEICSRRDKMYV